MSTIPRPVTAPDEADEPLELHSGDRMNRKEFHRIYEQMPDHFKAELIGGIVYAASPLRLRHGNRHLHLGSVFAAYEGLTAGTEAGDNTTILLGDEGEPQPDLFLRILPGYGGQSRTTADDYVQGAPELVAEIAHSSRAIDLHAKRDDYARNGVLEYLVLTLGERRLGHFDLRANRELDPDADGVVRARTFPGLWIDPQALLVKDYRRLMAVLQQGMATPEYTAFVGRLAVARSGSGETTS